MSRRLLAVLLFLAAACSDNPTPTEPPVLSVTPTTQWSGGEIQVTSGAFAGSSLPVLLAGAETLAVSRVSDSTILVVVPLGPSGPVAIDFKRGSQRYPIGEVQRVGFKSSTSITPGFFGEIFTARDGDDPVVVGALASQTTNTVQTLRPLTMTVTTYPGIRTAELYGVSPTNKPNEFVVLDSTFRPYIWRLWPTAALVDSPPARFAPPIRHLAKLSDSIWLQTSHHWSNTYRGSSAVYPNFGLQVESPWLIHLSSNGLYATHSVSRGSPGVHVYSTLTGDTLYSLGQLYDHAQAAAFSREGNRIFYLGGRGTDGDSLLEVQAANGQVIAGHRITEGTGFNIAADPDRDLVYAEILVDGWPTIMVFDHNLKLVGRLPGPPVTTTGACDLTCFEGTVAVDRSRNELHVIWANNTSAIWTFDLLP